MYKRIDKEEQEPQCQQQPGWGETHPKQRGKPPTQTDGQEGNNPPQRKKHKGVIDHRPLRGPNYCQT